jgi:murein DD-endopeptidase MepM/ murein hydrolase activator NlpD
MRLLSLFIGFVLAAGTAAGVDVSATLMADGFDFPVGKPDADGYYRSRGSRANGHLGEDWNGKGGGDTDLGSPVYSVAHGIVVLAQNCGHGWGNVVIVRHAYEEKGAQKLVDSFYAHLDRIAVRHGQALRRGALVGTIGTGGGLYPAHLHLEMRKDITVGMARHRFPRDDRVYWSPIDFIKARRRLHPTVTIATVPMNSFVPFDVAGSADSGARDGFRLPPSAAGTKPQWKPDRYSDLKKARGMQ